jgi:peptide deformylase
MGDDILTKSSKPIKEVNERLRTLIGDMLDTMYELNGVGLAAPQVGVLKRLTIIDVSEEADSPMILINPEVIATSGEQSGSEACLSLPGKAGMVTRPEYAKVKALNENMEEYVVEGEGLLARALLHEIDHLNGVLYVDKVEGELYDVTEEEEVEE